MKKLALFFIFILLLSGCCVNKKVSVNDTNNNQNETRATKIDVNNNSLNQLLINSGVYSESIYDGKKNVTELESARGRKFEIPDDYELALDVKYSADTSLNIYDIKILRQVNSTSTKESIDPTDRMPEKPLIIVIVKNKDIIVNLFVIDSYSVLEGSMGWEDYDKKEIASAVEIRDLNTDGFAEILVHTFKVYTAESENGLVTIYFDVKNNTFVAADKVFATTWKKAFEIVNINKRYYVLETDSGSGNCRFCPTPYLVRIYQFTGEYFFDIGSVGFEKEYEEGLNAIKDALPRVKKKILTGDVSTL